MQINGVMAEGSKTNFVGAGNKESDNYTTGIQKQIREVQKQINELGNNKELSLEEKAEKRKILNEQLQDLNKQLRDYENQKRQEKAKEKQASTENTSASGKTEASKKIEEKGMSTSEMQALISGDTAIKQSEVQGSVAGKMEGRAAVTEMEIKLDASRGGDTSAKEELLAELKEKAENATAGQMKTLAKAQEEIKNSNKEDVEKDKEGSDKEESETEKKAKPNYTNGGEYQSEALLGAVIDDVR